MEIVEYEWQEIRSKYRELIARDDLRESMPERSKLPGLMEELRRCKGKRDFYGATSRQMLGWLKQGFEVRKLPRNQRPEILDGQKPKWRWSDDPARGTYMHEAGMTGDPMMYLARDRRRSMAGIRIEVGTVFVCTTPPETVAEYGAWIGSVLRTLEAAGYDLDVSLIQDSKNLYRESGDTFRAKIKCSGFGKRTLFRDWSAVFSPGGYRHLTFMAWCLPEFDPKHARAAFALGHGTADSARDWSVEWEEATRTLTFIPQYRAYRFPADEVTAKLRDAIG